MRAIAGREISVSPADDGCRCEAGERRHSAVAVLLLGLIGFYKRCLSPAIPSACRFYPTCSQYAREAIERYGARRGSWLAVRRLLRCRPFGPKGYDPVE